MFGAPSARGFVALMSPNRPSAGKVEEEMDCPIDRRWFRMCAKGKPPIAETRLTRQAG
jgi:hypothetical protein